MNCPGQIFWERPFGGEILPPETPIKNLYISNSIWPHGTTGLGSGYIVAEEIAGKLGVREQNWWRNEPLDWWFKFLDKFRK